MKDTKTVIEVPIMMARSLLLQGIGVGFFTRGFVAEEIAAGKVVEIKVSDLPLLSRESAVVRHPRGGELSPALLQFIMAVKAEAEKEGIVLMFLQLSLASSYMQIQQLKADFTINRKAIL